MSEEWQSSMSKAGKHIIRVSKYEIGATLGEGTFGKFALLLVHFLHFFYSKGTTSTQYIYRSEFCHENFR